MNSSEQSINRLGDPTFFLEGVVHEKSDMGGLQTYFEEK